MNTESRVTLSLISHTNVGKTTLARTLLRRDVGEVIDRPHVTEVSEAHSMIELETGESLLLWDTPGFGDTARLLKRLKNSDHPILWILSQVWDRFADRPFWCSQQAIRNVREDADVVLYLVNAAEDPEAAAYIGMEMEILGWIGKPVIVLLNQIGPPRDATALEMEVARWRRHFQRFDVVRDVLSLDAFTRCWVQEHLLLDRVGEVLEGDKRRAFGRLNDAWRERNRMVFEQSMKVLARQLAAAVTDREVLEHRSLVDKFRRMLIRQELSDEELAMTLLAERASRSIAETTDELIRLHGLEGEAAVQILERLKSNYFTAEPVDEGLATFIGACFSGAATGLGADLLSGGLSLGGGAIVGAILGAMGGKGLAKGYNLVRGERTPYTRCSWQLFEALVRSALLRYLAVAHFGRGRGEYVEAEEPKTWQAYARLVVEQRRDRWNRIWDEARTNSDPTVFIPIIEPLLRNSASQILEMLYPDSHQALK